MATSTTNLGLIKPAASDKIRIAQLNQNSDTLDAVIGAVGSTSLQTQVSAIEDGIAIVANGDSHVAITAGQFVYVRNNTHNLTEGLYVASANVSANATITSSNMTADASGWLNALNSKIESVNITSGTILATITSMDRKKMPKCFSKSGATAISDAPLINSDNTYEFICWVVGHGDRLIAFVTRYSSSLATTYRRRIWQNTWSDNDWTVFNN